LLKINFLGKNPDGEPESNNLEHLLTGFVGQPRSSAGCTACLGIRVGGGRRGLLTLRAEGGGGDLESRRGKGPLPH